MKTKYIALALPILALLAQPASAFSFFGFEIKAYTPPEYTDTTRCSSIIANWVNAATENCASVSDNQRSVVSVDRSPPAPTPSPCPKDTKGDTGDTKKS